MLHLLPSQSYDRSIPTIEAILMSKKNPYRSMQGPHNARVKGTRYDFWAATDTGKEILSARREEAFVERLMRGGLSQDKIDEAVMNRKASNDGSEKSAAEGVWPSSSGVEAAIPYLIAIAYCGACLAVGFKIGSILGRRWHESRY